MRAVGERGVKCDFEEGLCLLTANAGEAGQKIVERIPRLEVSDQRGDRDTSPGEDWGAPLYIGIYRDHSASFHTIFSLLILTG